MAWASMMRKELSLLLCVATLNLFNLPASSAQALDQALKSCTTIEDSSARLDCYDALAQRDTPGGDDEPDGWAMATTKSAITGADDIVLTLPSQNAVPGASGAAEKAMLEVGCVENVTMVLFRMAGHYLSGHGDYGAVSVRLDATPVQTLRGSVTADNRAIGMLNGRGSIPLLRQMLDADTLVVSVKPVSDDGRAISAEFDLADLDSAIGPLRQSCGW